MELESARVLLAQSDPFERERIGRMLAPCAELSACAGFDEAARLLRERPYDLFLMPFAIRGADASTAREKICALRENSCPAMIVLLPEGLAQYENTLYNEGVACVLRAPAREGELRATVARLTPEDRLTPAWADAARIRSVLDRMSIGRNLKGYGYLLRAAGLLARDGSLAQQLGTVVYPLCAGDGRGESVERAIRHAIERAWLRGDLEAQYRLFGNTIDEAKGKPTNAEFLSRVVETLRMEA